MLQQHDDLCAHYLNLDFSENFLTETDVETHVELPYPIHKPFADPKTDIIKQYHEDTSRYYDQLARATKEFEPVKDNILGQNFHGPCVTLTKSLLDFYQKKKHEAPYSCDYNPYYATGLLEHFRRGSEEYLVRPDNANNLRVTDLQRPRKDFKVDLESSTKPITGISATTTPRDLFLLLRRRTRTDLLSLSDLQTLAEVRWSKKFDRPLLDSKMDRSRLGAVTDDLKLTLYDLKTQKKLSLNRYDLKSALKIDFVSETGLAVMDRHGLKILDGRSSEYRVFEPNLDKCDTLCGFKFKDGLVYLATRHHLLRTDVRMFGNPEHCGHLMKTSPCFLDLAGNYLCLSGQDGDERVVFEGRPVGGLPVGVPCLQDTLRECRLKRDVLLRDGLSERVEYSTAGVKILEQDGGTFLYTSNSLGEIFRQRIFTEPPENDPPIDALTNWISKLPPPPKPLRLTTMANLSAARFALNEPIMEVGLEKFRRKNKTSKFLKKFRAMYATEALGELGGHMAEVWDDDDDRDLEEDVADSLVPEVAPFDKVSSWIESNNFD